MDKKMNETPLVCICIPNYNNEKTIAETLDSIVNQTHQNMIIKIFDNASTDDSMKILREYEVKYPHIQVFQNEINIGGEGNFNKCIENLEGECGAIYHSDDIYETTMIEEQVNFLLENQECIAVSTDRVLIDDNSKLLFNIPLSQLLKTKGYFITNSQLEMYQKILEINNYIVCPSVMIKSEIYKNNIQEFDYKSFNTAADLDLWFRVCEFGKFGTILKPLMKYRYSENSYSFRHKLDVEKSDGVSVLEYYYKKYRDSLTTTDKQRYEFYCFKDKVRKTVNQILINDRDFKSDINILNLKIISQSLKSKKNFQFYLVGILVKFLRYFSLPKRIREKLINKRFNRQEV